MRALSNFFFLLCLVRLSLSAQASIPPINYLPSTGAVSHQAARMALYRNGVFRGYCSGVLVSKNIVLTARHCHELDEIPYVILGTKGQYEKIEVARIETTDRSKKLFNFYDKSGKISSRFLGTKYEKILAKDLLTVHLKAASRFEPAELIPQMHFSQLEKADLYVVGFPETSQQTEKWNSLSLPAPVRTPGICSIDSFKIDSPLIRTDCLASRGQSGGGYYTQIDGKPYLVGIHSTQSKTREHNPTGRNFGFTWGISLVSEKNRRFVELLILSPFSW